MEAGKVIPELKPQCILIELVVNRTFCLRQCAVRCFDSLYLKYFINYVKV